MIRLKDKPLTRKVISTPNDIGLIEAIRAAGKGNVLFKGHDFHRLPVEMIQIKQNVTYMDHGRVIRAVAGSYIAAYRRNDAQKPGIYFIAVLPQKNAMELLEKAKNTPKPQQSLYGLLHKSMFCSMKKSTHRFVRFCILKRALCSMFKIWRARTRLKKWKFVRVKAVLLNA